ncbi:MAG: Hg(II)-responsive transcriptional regulator [Rhodanobacteraceae bacterium]
MVSSLSIGKLAEAAGVNVETIRYYQRRDLLAEPAKPLGGQRRYPTDAIKRLRFIKRAQALGFTLDEVGTLLTLDRARACTPTRALAARKRALLEGKIADLTALHTALGRLIRQCDSRRGNTPCPIIETLVRDQ